jgi:hypothetical protein
MGTDFPGHPAREAPFELSGLTDFDGPRSVASVGGGGDRRVSLVSLGHGDRLSAPHRWVEVGVLGPLHGVVAPSPATPRGGTWTRDPESSPLFYLATAAFPDIPGGEVPLVTQALRDRGWRALELVIDGFPQTLRSLREGDHWIAVMELEPDHALYVCASHVAPEEVRLERAPDLDAYAPAETHPQTG